MASKKDVYWFLDAEYETVRDWILKNEQHRTDLLKINGNIGLPRIFFPFETFYEDKKE